MGLAGMMMGLAGLAGLATWAIKAPAAGPAKGLLSGGFGPPGTLLINYLISITHLLFAFTGVLVLSTPSCQRRFWQGMSVC